MKVIFLAIIIVILTACSNDLYIKKQKTRTEVEKNQNRFLLIPEDEEIQMPKAISIDDFEKSLITQKDETDKYNNRQRIYDPIIGNYID